MAEDNKASFEPFITVSLACLRQPYQTNAANKIAVASNAPGCTAIHMHDVPAARRLVAELNKLIDFLEPPMAVTDKHLGVQRPKRKAKKARRK
jgi:hypothetical protein